MLLGSGELGKEFVIAVKRLGQHIIAVDSYNDAPAQQVADEREVINMLDGAELDRIVAKHRPDIIVPEIEAIRTERFYDYEQQGIHIVPSAKAANYTMNRRAIRDLAAKDLGLRTAAYRYAGSLEELQEAVNTVGIPCVVKPLMSSSGKGQSVIRSQADIDTAWNYAQSGKRGDQTEVIVEAFVRFNSEITLLTITQQNGPTLFCLPIGHRQERGDYQESWQPAVIAPDTLAEAQDMAAKVTNALTGAGIWGVEFFLADEGVYFSELSPRPHDTGMVTLAGTQNLSEFELHARAVLGLPIPAITHERNGASTVILADKSGSKPVFTGVDKVLNDPKADIRLFGKPTTRPYRRMGVVLAYDRPGTDVDTIRQRAIDLAKLVTVAPTSLLLWLFLFINMCLLTSFRAPFKYPSGDPGEIHPRIVNIVNFIRLLEPRDPKITEDVLYQTVVQQIDMMKKYKLGGTFLLQYDALMDPRYQQLLKSLPRDSFEIGAWWEIPQPLVEKAGLKWNGRYPWDWRANIGFSTGYSPADREKLADVYMEDFKKIFGYYPKSVGSWFIDAHTLAYLYKKYHIVASCNCKDQYGTDGYTLWGGYWNQAYYPSRSNSYMPAQHEKDQIPVPIFRMLGSDPVRQYDNGLGTTRQGVITLEPVYKDGGGDSSWVNWYFKQFVEGASMGFAYAQAGQENSFTWDAMSKGFAIQLPLMARLRDEHKIKVETLEQSGTWFREQYKLIPPTAVTINEDIKGSNRKTVWFDSRFYRLNLIWEDGHLRFRDIHLFDEKLPSVYETQKATANECSFFTLPVVDGYIWSKPPMIAGLRFKAIIDGKDSLIEGGNPAITDAVAGKLTITWPILSFEGTMVMDIDERQVSITMITKTTIQWYLDLTAAAGVPLPFKKIHPDRVDCQFEGLDYIISAPTGSFSEPGSSSVLRITPHMNALILNFTNNQ